jgi:hypothetical protein
MTALTAWRQDRIALFEAALRARGNASIERRIASNESA